ncbi:DUF624 domain-containing protein [Salipaludibacillus agaradhaerens]|uniref:DUF624 domain-containing protein n=1 Tax=Salipaludibacillus agaradhaerens TaxID=76935 RepID=A0A9Q4FX12_SALAG|nr:DUF624 domain-containing protein [Salipaludibacillus agaradhaerens]MCR6095086.1 DUF624 domain-containing protein [Salipaludibacillus agaradhaerens]MCR6115356.1 DUF624 domain-containing protein [Salipaludibacillus agaradhaerens]
MLNRGVLKIIYEIMVFITRMAYLNILWILFTLSGGIVAGLAPATAAIFSVIHLWIQGKEPPVFKSFWVSYKQYFLKANLLLIPLFIVSNLLYIDFRYLTVIDGTFYYVMLFTFINASLLFFILSIYLFPTLILFNYPIMKTYKTALFIGLAKPLHTLALAIVLYSILRIVLLIPGLIPLFPVALFSYASMAMALSAHKKVINHTQQPVN